jgi:hypothetical protein
LTYIDDDNPMTRRHYQHRHRRQAPASTSIASMSMVKVVGVSIAAGVMIAAGIVAFEKPKLAVTPAPLHSPPYRKVMSFRGAMRFVSLALPPLYSNEPGYSARMDGDGDGSLVSLTDGYQQRNVALQHFNPDSCLTGSAPFRTFAVCRNAGP